MPNPVILLHGLWMRGFTMGLLARRLRACGHAVQTFDYWSLAGGPEPAIATLERRIAAIGGIVDLVGHSLGGLIALEALRTRPTLPVARAVCLGSPLMGSNAARHLAHWPGGKHLLGKSGALLAIGVPPWNDAREIGVIAGRAQFGLGLVAGDLLAPHDGTVSVAETELPGVADHRVVAATHTGLAFSEEVAALTAGFLSLGRFPR